MGQVAEAVAALARAGDAMWRRIGLEQRESAVGTLGVVVLDVLGGDVGEVTLAADQDPVEALVAEQIRDTADKEMPPDLPPADLGLLPATATNTS